MGSMCRHAYKIFVIIFRIYLPILFLNIRINRTKTNYFVLVTLASRFACHYQTGLRAKFNMLSLTHGAKYSEHRHERGIQ